MLQPFGYYYFLGQMRNLVMNSAEKKMVTKLSIRSMR